MTVSAVREAPYRSSDLQGTRKPWHNIKKLQKHQLYLPNTCKVVDLRLEVEDLMSEVGSQIIEVGERRSRRISVNLTPASIWLKIERWVALKMKKDLDFKYLCLAVSIQSADGRTDRQTHAGAYTAACIRGAIKIIKL